MYLEKERSFIFLFITGQVFTPWDQQLCTIFPAGQSPLRPDPSTGGTELVGRQQGSTPGLMPGFWQAVSDGRWGEVDSRVSLGTRLPCSYGQLVCKRLENGKSRFKQEREIL